MRLLHLMILSLLIAACHAEPSPTPLKRDIELTLNRAGQDFAKDYPEQLGIDMQPAGINFYEFYFKPSGLGTAHINAGEHSFSIKNVFYIMGTENPDAKQGISNYIIKAGLSTPEFIDHNQARLNMAAILQNLLSKGWEHYITQSDPRIKGKETVTYILEKPYSLYGADPAYTPTLDEWMQIRDGTAWHFYANHRYLSIKLERDTDKLDKNQPGVYMVSFEIRTEDDLYRNDFGEENIAPERWRTLWKEKKLDEQLAQERAKREAELLKQGYHIDTSYRDPVFLPVTE